MVFPLHTGRKLNVHKTFRRRLMYVQSWPTKDNFSRPSLVDIFSRPWFNLRRVSRELLMPGVFKVAIICHYVFQILTRSNNLFKLTFSRQLRDILLILCIIAGLACEISQSNLLVNFKFIQLWDAYFISVKSIRKKSVDSYGKYIKYYCSRSTPNNICRKKSLKIHAVKKHLRFICKKTTAQGFCNLTIIPQKTLANLS